MIKNLLDRKHFKKQTGQILIIFLLILVVGLALVLSVASRSITDIRLTTSSDESNRAYFAAEAGVEEALAQLQKDQTYAGGELNFTAVNQTKANVNVSDLDSPSGGNAFKFPEEYDRDSVVQVNLLTDFNNLSGGTPVGAGDQLKIYYGNGSGTTPAIEVSVVHTNGAGGWGIKKFAYDSDSSRTNKFCNADDTAGTIATQDGDFDYDQSVVVNFMGGYNPTGCAGPGTILDGVGSATPVLARIRLLYNDQPQPIAVGTNSTFNLPVQGSEVVSTGSTVSGVTRKLRVTKLFPALPAIFDYVLFSGTDLTK